jgi:hypothetical protein
MEKQYIAVDSDFGKKIGFTSKYFQSLSYMFLDNDTHTIIIPIIEAREIGKGSFSRVFHNLQRLKYTIKVIEPSKLFMSILLHYGFTSAYEPRGEGFEDLIDVWSKNGNNKLG